jgi:two-component system NarL family response regulator
MLVDDHAVVREALATLVGLEPDMLVVAQSGTRQAALRANLELAPDVIVLDFQLADGSSTDSIGELIQTEHRPKILMLSSFPAGANVFASLDAGASGYLLKSSEAHEVLAAIRTVARGGTAYAPEFLGRRNRIDRTKDLTKRELEVLALIAKGLSNESIAETLSLSLGTVKSHVHNLLEKLVARSRTEAIALARDRGLITD